MPKQELISVGKISGVFGVKGWIKVYSFTDIRESILEYSPWLLMKAGNNKTIEVADAAIQGKALIAQLKGINDRTTAEALVGWEIFIRPEQLPELSEGEYYWSDLIGLNVETQEGVALGMVDGLLETGANDVMMVKGEKDRAIPFLQGQTILSIDLTARKMIVDWDPEF
ncbi:ribosome maturation factor RimM [Methylosoma difficile]